MQWWIPLSESTVVSAGRVGGGGLWRLVFARVSKIAFGSMVWLSFKWLFATNSVWM